MWRTNTKTLFIPLISILVITFSCNQTKDSPINQNKTYKNFDKPIFYYKSTSNDLENSVDIIQTNNEVSYHTFDFNKNLITLKSKTEKGDWKLFEYPFLDYRTFDNKSMEFDIDSPICNQVWISSMGNIGYELKNGQKLVFYEITQLEK